MRKTIAKAYINYKLKHKRYGFTNLLFIVNNN